MTTNPEPEFNLHIPRKNILSITLLLIVLISFLFFYVSVINKSSTSENTPKPEGSTPVTTMPPITGETVYVKNENELKNAIKNTPNGGSTAVVMNNDITLTASLLIPINKNISLSSNKNVGFYKLIGAANVSTVIVEAQGILCLDGIIVTHANGKNGRGITVDSDGILIMYRGEISGNFAEYVKGVGPYYWFSGEGGGVYNVGIFEVYGGKISNNTSQVNGGGVFNRGVFNMFSGEISNNKAPYDVSTERSSYGGGVFNFIGCSIVMSGGVISDNSALYGGGVSNSGTFTMSGGKISSNTAVMGGGVFNWNVHDAILDRTGGVISGNKASHEADDVYFS